VSARYDGEFAAWYDGWIADPDVDPVVRSLFGVIGDVVGRRILELGCGQGRIARRLAAGGSEVVGVDLSADMLANAGETPGVTYHHASATTTAWWDGTPFDGVVASMALMDIDDLAGAVRTAATTVKPGGWFAWSINHPAFPGIEHVRSSWPTGGSYFDEGLWFTDGVGVRGRVGANHRTLSTYLGTCIAAGFVLEAVDEPPWRLSPDHPALPFFLITRWRKISEHPDT
jgi:2-polyprenyl-3-methyl-5-hydroxy-6-metoxy-1,4-benzoquinol methylase